MSTSTAFGLGVLVTGALTVAVCLLLDKYLPSEDEP